MLYLCDPHSPWPEGKMPMPDSLKPFKVLYHLRLITLVRRSYYPEDDGIWDHVAGLSVETIWTSHLTNIWLSVEPYTLSIACKHVFTLHSAVLQCWPCCKHTRAELAVFTHIWSVKVLFCLHTDWRECTSVQTIGQQGGTPVSLTRTTPPSGSTTTWQWWPPMPSEMLLQTPLRWTWWKSVSCVRECYWVCSYSYSLIQMCPLFVIGRLKKPLK